jgi:hypothetical protein
MASINTMRVKLGGIDKAREWFKENGYQSEDGVTYHPQMGEEGKEEDVEPPAPPVPSYTPSGDKPVLVTSYLFGSSVNPVIFSALEAHAVQIGAEIIVIAHKYTNPTSLQGCLREEEGSDYVDPLVKPYLCWDNLLIHGHDILGAVQVNCNNLNPLPRIKKFTTRHSILGHPMQSLHVKPVVQGQGMPMVLWSTGTISNIDPASNLTAQQAQFHYKFGWIVLESDGSSRNVHTTKSGNFTDKSFIYHTSNHEISYSTSTLATIWGDVHAEQVDKKAMLWAVQLTESFNSPTIVLHDFFDATAVNPHSSILERNGHNLYDDFRKAQTLLNDIQKDTKCSLILLVESNHNDMLSRFFKRTPVQDMTPASVSLLSMWLSKGMKPEELFTSAEILRIDESYPTLHGTNLGMHGDKGINGARGSLMSLFQANIRAAIGHSHTPGMLGGVSQLGCLCLLKQGYNDKGASSWLHSIMRLDIFGKHQHFIKFF